MPIEDFTTYTQVDTGDDRIQLVGTNRVNHYAWQDEDTYLYRDYGARRFGNFTHQIDARSDFGTPDATYMWGFIWGLSNELDDAGGLLSNNYDFIGLSFRREVSGRSVRLYEFTGGSFYLDSWTGPALNTWYYFTIQKIGTLLTVDIYSDSARTNLLDTLSLTLQSDYLFRYIYACNTYNSAEAFRGTNNIENLILNLVMTPYELTIGGNRYNFNSLSYTDKHPKDSPTKFTVVLPQYQPTPAFGDEVIIRKDGIVVFRGLVEEIEINIP